MYVERVLFAQKLMYPFINMKYLTFYMQIPITNSSVFVILLREIMFPLWFCSLHINTSKVLKSLIPSSCALRSPLSLP